MEQKNFHGILKRYLNGQASEEEKQIIDAWYEAMGKGPHSHLNSLEESALEKRYWSVIASHVSGTKRTLHADTLQKDNKIRRIVWYSLSAAASLLLIMVSYIFLVAHQEPATDNLAQKEIKTVETWTHLANSLATAQQFELPDGSHITLEPQSRLRYPSSFNQAKREIFLEGEAMFEVYRNEQRPFLVYTKEVTTMVLGTSFRVKAYEEDKNITVAVRTGKVSVYTNHADEQENSKEAEIILTPNQQVIYNRNEKTIQRRLVEEPQAIPSEEKIRRMRFEEAPVKEIFEALEKVYGVDIVFDEKRFSTCALTTSISDGGIYNRLDIICNAIGAEYTLEETQILITGSGCN